MPNQKHRLREEVDVAASSLINMHIEGGKITRAGVEANINVALQYLESWLRGIGAAAIHNLMEDAATAEISRAELWQWIRHQAIMGDGRPMSAEFYREIREHELSKLGGTGTGQFRIAAEILDQLVLGNEFTEFLTAYKQFKRCVRNRKTLLESLKGSGSGATRGPLRCRSTTVHSEVTAGEAIPIYVVSDPAGYYNFPKPLLAGKVLKGYGQVILFGSN